MRGALLLLGILLAAPSTLAQAPEVVLVEIEVAPLEAPLKPLHDPVTVPVSVRASCALADGDEVPVRLEVREQPPWVNVVVSPDLQPVSVAACDGGRVVVEAELEVRANDQAPAFSPAPLRLAAVAGEGAREREAVATVELSAAWFSILDVQLPRAIDEARPGTQVAFPLKLTNFGNGPTRVSFELGNVTGDLQVQLPSPFVLESKQRGGTDVARDVEILVTTREARGFVNEVGVVNLRILTHSQDDPSLPGDDSSISVLVTTKTGAVPAAERTNESPAPGPLVALVLGALLLRRR